MSEASEETTLQQVADRVLADRLGPLWKRLGPLSAGAVGSAVVVLAGTEVVRRLARMRKRRHLGLWGSLALMPLVARALVRSGTADDTETREPPGSVSASQEVRSAHGE